jgi:hypothetical protein
MPGLRSALDATEPELGSLCHIYQAYTVLPHPFGGRWSDQASGVSQSGGGRSLERSSRDALMLACRPADVPDRLLRAARFKLIDYLGLAASLRTRLKDLACRRKMIAWSEGRS